MRKIERIGPKQAFQLNDLITSRKPYIKTIWKVVAIRRSGQLVVKFVQGSKYYPYKFKVITRPEDYRRVNK